MNQLSIFVTILIVAILLTAILCISFMLFLQEQKMKKLIKQNVFRPKNTLPSYMPDTLGTIQESVHSWHRYNYPQDDMRDALLAVGEELGELNRAQVKQASGIRGSFEHWQKEKEKEIGDTLIATINYAAWNDIDWISALMHRWLVIKQRDFIKNPQTGGREAEE